MIPYVSTRIHTNATELAVQYVTHVTCTLIISSLRVTLTLWYLLHVVVVVVVVIHTLHLHISWYL